MMILFYCNEDLKHNDYDENWFKRFNVTLPKNNILYNNSICISKFFTTYKMSNLRR